MDGPQGVDAAQKRVSLGGLPEVHLEAKPEDSHSMVDDAGLLGLP